MALAVVLAIGPATTVTAVAVSPTPLVIQDCIDPAMPVRLPNGGCGPVGSPPAPSPTPVATPVTAPTLKAYTASPAAAGSTSSEWPWAAIAAGVLIAVALVAGLLTQRRRRAPRNPGPHR